MFEFGALARWGAVAGTFLFMMVRPAEWMPGWGSEWKQDQFFSYRFPHVPRENYVDQETHELVYKPFGS
jgi:hypothetical protein